MKAKPIKKPPVVVPKPQQAITSLAGGLDQMRPVPKLREYMDTIVTAATKSDLPGTLEILNRLGSLGQLSAVGKSAALWHIRDRWEALSGKEFDSIDGRNADFYEFIFGEAGYMPDTTKRYCKVWDFLNEARVNLGATSDTYEALLQRDIKDLIGLGQYTTEHGLLTKKQLTELAAEPDSATLRKKLNEYKGKDPAGTGAQLVLQADGTLEYWKDDEGAYVGFIQLNGDSELGQQGRAALIRRAKIQER